MRGIGKTEDVVRHIVPLHRVPARTQRKPTVECVDGGAVLAHELIGGHRNLIQPFAIDPGRAEFALSLDHERRSRHAEILRHLAERLEDHRVFKVAEIGTVDARERQGAGVRLAAGHRIRTPGHGAGWH